MKALFLALMLVPVMAFAGSREVECQFGQEKTLFLDGCVISVQTDSQQLVAQVKGASEVFVHRFRDDELRNGCFLIKSGAGWRLSYTGAVGARSGCYYLTWSYEDGVKRDNVVADSAPVMPVAPALSSRPVPEVRETLVDIPSDKVSTVPCGSSMVRLSLAADQVNVYGWVDGRRFKMPKVMGYDSDRTNRTLVYSGFDGWRIYYLDGAGAGPGKVRIAVLKE